MLLSGVILLRHAPKLRRPELHRIREILHYGKTVAVLRPLGVLHRTMDRLIVGAIIGPSAVALVEIATQLQNGAEAILSAASYAVVPGASWLHAREDRATLRDLLERGTRYSLVVTLPIVVGIAVLANPIVDVWVGPKYSAAAGLAVVALLYTAVTGPLQVGSNLLVGVGRAGDVLRAALLAVAINLVASIVLVNAIGIVGAFIGALLGALLLVPILARAFLRQTETSAAEFVRTAIAPTLVPNVLLAAICGLTLLLPVGNLAMIIDRRRGRRGRVRPGCDARLVPPGRAAGPALDSRPANHRNRGMNDTLVFEVEHHVDAEGRTFPFVHLGDRASTDLVVHFSAFFGKWGDARAYRDRFQGYFHRLKMLGTAVDHNWLFLCDPYGAFENGTYYTGQAGDFFVERAMRSIIDRTISNTATPLDQVITVGSSMGATAALKLGLQLPVRGIVAITPHIDLDVSAAAQDREAEVAFICPDGDPYSLENRRSTRQISNLLADWPSDRALPRLFIQSMADDAGVHDEQVLPLVAHWRALGGSVDLDTRPTGGHTSDFATGPLLLDAVDRQLRDEPINVDAYAHDPRYAGTITRPPLTHRARRMASLARKRASRTGSPTYRPPTYRPPTYRPPRPRTSRSVRAQMRASRPRLWWRR